MTSKGHALSRDALVRTLTAYSGITTSDGAADGTTLVDSNLIGRNDFVSEKTILIMSGDAKDEDKGATAFDNSDGKITLQGTGVSAQIKAGTIFRVLNVSSIEIDVANVDAKVGTNADAAGTTTVFAWLVKLFEQGGQGLVYYGKVTQVDDATHFRVSGLAGFGDAYFANNYRVYVVWDAAGGGAAPQSEMQPCSGYADTDEIFTHTAFTTGLAVDDEVLLIHERIAEVADLLANVGAMNAAATADDLSDVTTTDALAKLRRLLLRFSSGAFSVPVDGSARTDLDTIYTNLAIILGARADAIPAMNAAPGTTAIVPLIKAALERIGATPNDPDDSLLTVVGQRDATATSDDLSDVTTTDALAKLRRLLLRFSSGAFSVPVDGSARTDLDAILTNLAIIAGARADAIPAMNAAPGTAAIVPLIKAILERVGATPNDPDDSLLTVVGQRDATATSDDLSDVTTTDALAKLRLLLNRLSTDAFTATIQGAGRTELDIMLAQLATYFSASGAAMSLQVNNQTARTNLEQALEDFFAVVGIDGANVFNPSIGGSARTDLDAALTAMAVIIAAIPTTMVGTDNAATVADGWDAALATILDNFSPARIGYLDELDFDLQALLNAIAAYLDTEIAAILALVDSAESAGPFAYLDAGAEQDVVVDTAVTRRRIFLDFSNRGMAQTGTFRIYRKVDGANYDLYTTVPCTVGAGDDRAFDAEFTTNQPWKLTYEEDVDEAAARSIPYNVITQVIE